MSIIKLVKKSIHKKKNIKHHKHRKRSLFNQRGKTKLLILIAAVAILLAQGGIYLVTRKTNGTNPNQKTSVSLPSVQPTLNPNCEYNDPELCKYLTNGKNYENVSSVTRGIEGKKDEGDEIFSEISVSESGEMSTHMVIKQDGEETSNTIHIGDTYYDYDHYRKIWWKDTLTSEEKKSSEQIQENMKKFALEHKGDPHHTMEYKFIMKEACGDRMCFKYESNYMDQPEVKILIWFDDQEYLKRKERFVDPGAEDDNETIFSYGNVHITPPTPVKESTH